MTGLSNNQRNENERWNLLCGRLRELEAYGGMRQRPLWAEWWGELTGEEAVSITVPSLQDGTRRGYTIYGPSREKPRVTWGEGNGPHEPRGYHSTRSFLNHVIQKVEEEIMYVMPEEDKAILTDESWGWSDDQPEDTLCPCGHPASQHYMEDAHCEVAGCGCPQFGEPVENWHQPTQVWYTEPPSGHCGWE